MRLAFLTLLLSGLVVTAQEPGYQEKVNFKGEIKTRQYVAAISPTGEPRTVLVVNGIVPRYVRFRALDGTNYVFYNYDGSHKYTGGVIDYRQFPNYRSLEQINFDGQIHSKWYVPAVNPSGEWRAVLVINNIVPKYSRWLYEDGTVVMKYDYSDSHSYAGGVLDYRQFPHYCNVAQEPDWEKIKLQNNLASNEPRPVLIQPDRQTQQPPSSHRDKARPSEVIK